ncbi:hypothetical protein [Telluribacter sp. SYSU D00476]|uniref:hypothetical protein n=1 Tax=Telluribacter sp. SYSU D00476 TaxID=2811430 RepID=UPI001FF3C7D9|nr:hypothetical protein [Telluribacter sp. SYSU D00476]
MQHFLRLTLGLFVVLSTQAFSQSSPTEWYFTPNANLYLPGQSSDKATSPLLWYDHNRSPRVQVGGFGIGTTALTTWTRSFSLKTQANLSRNSYWDSPFDVRDQDGRARGFFQGAASDYTLGLTSTLQLGLTKGLSVGTGLGGRMLLVSQTRWWDFDNSIELTPGKLYPNKQYRRFMPVVPAEVMWKAGQVMLNARYEWSLLGDWKSMYPMSQSEKHNLLVVEVGIPLSRN